MGKFYADKQKHSQQEKKGGGQGGGKENDIFLGFHLVLSFICWHNITLKEESEAPKTRHRDNLTFRQWLFLKFSSFALDNNIMC